MITSPGYPSSYPSNSNCKWEVTVDAKKVILIEFEDFEIEEDSDCGFDKLSVQEKDGVRIDQLIHHLINK